MIKSNYLDVCDAYCIFFNHCNILKKESYRKPDGLIYDDYYYQYYYCDDVYGDVNDINVITDVKLDVQNTQYTKIK